ncbi:hypothetical protein SUGI_0661390 [Cryptomeria japonica]|nr:hypothetical protein SUGI_0661390 [Cryptomeria japonica]
MVMLDVDYMKVLMDKLASRHPVPMSREDKILWCATKSSNYSCNLGYEVTSRMWEWCKWQTELCWEPHILPKVGAFVWLAMQNQILTGDRLMKLNFSRPYKCLMCYNHKETLDRLVVQCKVAKNVGSFSWGS